MANFVSYSNATSLMTAIGNKIKALNGAYIAKGNSTFANLPSPLTSDMTGFVYNVTDAFTTTSDFVEGAGKDYPANTNVGIINIGDSTTPVMKFDVFAGFIDVDALEEAIADVSAMIADEFDKTQAYAIGDIVTYQGDLYTFTAAHTADADWSSSIVSATTVEDLIAALDTRVTGVNTRVGTIVADIAPAFDATQAYAIGAIVVHEDGLYKFTSAHTANDPWSSSEVTAVTVSSLISAAEPDQLTTEQVNTLIGLLS